MDRQAHILMDRLTDTQMDCHKNRLMYRQTNRQIDGETDTQMDCWTVRHMHGQTDRQADIPFAIKFFNSLLVLQV